ncbi:MAG: hypothetical protein IPH07_30050 [Deltaproteobacteria bacterium]|nr:hypothetical protein [Deltaproteobacteria bacterium]MBK8715158.1 hypothetical protein [Deltaproteobacteria bacterium]MBP7285136.1 hypothetical protein [Nannocystaceae bacterium]
MQNPRESFLAQVRTPDLDTEVFELRQNLTNLKREALAQAKVVEEERARLVMPGLYEQMVQIEVQLAGHIGLGVALALSVLDEHHSGASLSQFDRELREQMSETASNLATRHGSRLAKMVAQVEAQRLVWRHSHEFMSWLAFRRADERYPAKDRLERLDAFGVQSRLLEARTVVIGVAGVRLSAALEGADRFNLGNRWRLSPTPEHALERYVWPLLSYMPATTVKIERFRWEYDTMVEAGAPDNILEAERAKLAGMLEAQFADALGDVPETARAGML